LQNRYVGLLKLRQYELIGQIGIVRSENIPVLPFRYILYLVHSIQVV